MNDNLSKELREVANEANSLMMASVAMSVTSHTDVDEIVTNAQAVKLVKRLLDLCCDMFDEQHRLMAKMDRVMDKYLME